MKIGIRLLLLTVFCLHAGSLQAQKHAEDSMTSAERSWSLQHCIEYAMDNNLQIAESVINERMARLVWQQQVNNRMPSLNADASVGESYGRSIDPTSNQFVSKGFGYNSLGVSTQTLLFGWFQKKYQSAQSRLDYEASQASYNQLKDDIALNIATGFLRVLLAREQVKVSEAKLKLSNEQFQQTETFAKAGKVPELNVAQMLSQVSSDSAVWVSAMSDERISVLQLRALMNIDFETPFNIQAPDIDIAQLSALSALPNAEAIFETATQNQYRMKYNALKLESAKRGLAFTRSLQYPQLSLVANLGTSFSSANQTIVGQTYTGETVVGSIKIGSTDYPITQPNYHFDTQTKPLDLQYRDNLRANIGIAVSVPILNGLTAHNNIEKAKLGLLSQQITLDSDKLKLKQDIYKAYEEARASAQKYIAAKRSEEAAQRAMDFAGKRYNIGMISTFEYTSTLNTLFNASSSVLSAKYDLIFKLKVLDYYMGNPIKL